MFRKTDSVDQDLTQLSADLDRCRTRSGFLTEVAATLACFLKEFALEFDELDVQGFRCKIDKLVEELRSVESNGICTRAFESRRKQILDHIARQHEYLDRREAEFKETIDLLLNGLTELSDEDRSFSRTMQDSNNRMEELARLDDIVGIREGVKTEIGRMREIIRKKQNANASRLDSLSREVDQLKSSLQLAQDASVTDSLTGASNRVGVEIQLSKCMDRSIVTNKPLSLLMLDIDDFKRINDTYGHPVGDVVLKTLVQECRKHIRGDDPIGRYGGEEFVIGLPEASLRDAMKRAKALCGRIASKRYLVDYKGEAFTIAFTVSAGVSEFRRNDTLASLIARADDALYAAKSAGKNRAVAELRQKKAA